VYSKEKAVKESTLAKSCKNKIKMDIYDEKKLCIQLYQDLLKDV